MKANYLKFYTFQHYSSFDKKLRGHKKMAYIYMWKMAENYIIFFFCLHKKHILIIIYILGGVLQKAKLNVDKNML